MKNMEKDNPLVSENLELIKKLKELESCFFFESLISSFFFDFSEFKFEDTQKNCEEFIQKLEKVEWKNKDFFYCFEKRTKFLRSFVISLLRKKGEINKYSLPPFLIDAISLTYRSKMPQKIKNFYFSLFEKKNLRLGYIPNQAIKKSYKKNPEITFVWTNSVTGLEKEQKDLFFHYIYELLDSIEDHEVRSIIEENRIFQIEIFSSTCQDQETFEGGKGFLEQFNLASDKKEFIKSLDYFKGLEIEKFFLECNNQNFFRLTSPIFIHHSNNNKQKNNGKLVALLFLISLPLVFIISLKKALNRSKINRDSKIRKFL